MEQSPSSEVDNRSADQAVSLLCSQEHITGLYTEPVDSRPESHTLYL
jgi:hypothetical protein